MKLAGGGGELVGLFGARALRERVLKAFPDLEPEIDEDDGVHLVMAALDRAIMGAARRADLLRARSILGFVDSLLERSDLDPEIPNAVCISFVEPAVLEESATGKQLWGRRCQVGFVGSSCRTRIESSAQGSERAAEQGVSGLLLSSEKSLGVCLSVIVEPVAWSESRVWERGGLQTYLRPLEWSPRGLRAMTESARREPIDDNGLEGHNCCRLSLRRSDLFCRHATLRLQPWAGTPFVQSAVVVGRP